eukprot:SAG11_NODE_9115_length_941_cov_1.231591_1_plen_127_part_10
MAPVLDVGFFPETRQILLLRHFFPQGSLRDLVIGGQGDSLAGYVGGLDPRQESSVKYGAKVSQTTLICSGGYILFSPPRCTCLSARRLASISAGACDLRLHFKSAFKNTIAHLSKLLVAVCRGRRRL